MGVLAETLASGWRCAHAVAPARGCPHAAPALPIDACCARFAPALCSALTAAYEESPVHIVLEGALVVVILYIVLFKRSYDPKRKCVRPRGGGVGVLRSATRRHRLPGVPFVLAAGATAAARLPASLTARRMS